MQRIKIHGKIGQGLYALIDDEDYPLVSKYRWHYTTMGGYAETKIYYKLITMHRLLMRAKPGQIIDHANRNGLDNRRSNLRFCTRNQNGYNQTSHKGSSSKYKGVCWVKRDKRWAARINVNGVIRRIGYFKEERHAALAYDLWAIYLHKEFARTNFTPLTKR